jgi:hypothetical protein
MESNRRDFLKMMGLGLASSHLSGVNFMPEHHSDTDINVPLDPDLEVASKHRIDLSITEPSDESAPKWLRDADMVSHFEWYSEKGFEGEEKHKRWKGYDVDFYDVPVETKVWVEAGRSIKKMMGRKLEVVDGEFDGSAIQGLPLISHAPRSAAAAKQAHEQGFRLIPYAHFSDTHYSYAEQDIFMFEHPEILLRDKEGHWVHQVFGDPYSLYRLLTCANNPSYWKLSLAYVRKLMDMGMDGIFIDNIGFSEKRCYGPKFVDKRNAEFISYTHDHLFSEANQEQSFNRLLGKIREVVKSYGDDKIVVLNPGRVGTPYQKNGDCSMWESFIYSWAWKGRKPEDTWAKIKRVAKENEWFYNMGRRIAALSYLNATSETVKEDAFWAFSAARLVGFIWWGRVGNSGYLGHANAEILYKAHMGEPMEELKEKNGVAYKTFENGIIVLNNNDDRRKNIKVPVAKGFASKSLIDIFEGKNSKKIRVDGAEIKVTVPGKRARVYMNPESMS